MIVRRLSSLAAATLLAILAGGSGRAGVEQDRLSLADPLLGVDASGNVLPGATVPFGFVTVGPQTTRGDTSGYDSDSPIIGFASTFVSGTGGASKYGNFRTTPTIGAIEPNHLAFARSDEVAAPGYYGVKLGSGADHAIRADFTATRFVGLHRYTFPAVAQSNVLIDVTSAILMGGDGQIATGAEIEVIDDHTIGGWASFRGGWNPAPYKLYFRATFDRPAASIGTWRTTLGSVETRDGVGRVTGGDQTRSPRPAPSLSAGVSYSEGGDGHGDITARFGAFARFDTRVRRTVQMKLAVSFTSEAKAARNLEEQAPGWAFEGLRAQAAAAWREALAPITVDGGTPEQRRAFYTGLYRVHTMPHDVTGENVWWRSDEPHYEDFYTLWDTFRTVTPLLTLIHPQRQRDIVRSLLDTYKHSGWLPDARIAGTNGLTQGGSNGDVVVADAIVKHLGGFDTDLAYAAIKHDGDDESPDPITVGRSLKDYLRIGYVPIGQTRSASRTMEYAYDDFAISLAATALGKQADARRFRDRSRNWRNLWDVAAGCIHPRYADGRWLENYDCAYGYPDRTALWWDSPFYEASGLVYSTYVPHDLPCLIAKVGGRARYVAWLDRFFDGGHYEQGNEPSFLAAFNYIATGRPDRTDERVRAIMTTKFRTGRKGLPGNDDAGAMSAWYVWNAIGLYPNAGQPYYFIGAPLFRRTTLSLEGGRHFTIDAPATSAANRYVVAAALDGRPIDRAWITHDELMAGGTLTLRMGARPGHWAMSPSAAPPAPLQQGGDACASF